MKKPSSEYLEVVKIVLDHPEFQKRKTYAHHGEESVYTHSIKVSFLAYRIAKHLPIDETEVALAALLHDFYDKPWQENKEKKSFFRMHGFVHAHEAYVNAHLYFDELLNNKMDDMILRHMFPLNIRPPRYLGSWVVTISDKIVSLNIFKNPTKLYRYIGINKKNQKTKERR